jgi:hypothetical protein
MNRIKFAGFVRGEFCYFQSDDVETFFDNAVNDSSGMTILHRIWFYHRKRLPAHRFIFCAANVA